MPQECNSGPHAVALLVGVFGLCGCCTTHDRSAASSDRTDGLDDRVSSIEGTIESRTMAMRAAMERLSTSELVALRKKQARGERRFQCLRILTARLPKGSSRAVVREMLGEPDASLTKEDHYYEVPSGLLKSNWGQGKRILRVCYMDDKFKDCSIQTPNRAW